MMKHPKLTAASVCIFVAALAGCSSEPTCDYADAPYLNAQELPPLQIPEGLDKPDQTNTLTVPAANERLAKPADGAKSRCLDRPPSYFATGEVKKDVASSPDTSSSGSSADKTK